MDSNGRTALHWAANRGDYDAVCALIRCGADPSIKISPLGRIGFGPSDEGRTPLHCASQMHDDDPIIIHALLDAGSDVNAKDRDWKTPLFMASYNNNPRCLDALLCRGAEIDVQDEEGFTALLGAITWNNHDSLKVLMRRGANLHKVTEDGWNIWQWAIACADEGTLRILADIPVYYPNSMAYPPIDEKIQKFAIERTQLRGSSASKYYQIDHSWYSALKNMMNKMSMKHETLASLQSVEHKSGHGEQNEDSDSDSGFIDAPEYLPERSAV